MTNDPIDKTLRANRRDFLVGVVGAASMSPRAVLATAATTTVLAEAAQPASAQTANAAAGSGESKLPLPVPGYLSFGPDEAGFVEAMVNVMCPADALTPERRRLRACGLHRSPTRRRLRQGRAAIYARAVARRQAAARLPVSAHARAVLQGRARCRRCGLPKAVRQALRALDDRAARTHFFTKLPTARSADDECPLASWFNELVYPLFEQACFADPDLRRQSRQGVLANDRLSRPAGGSHRRTWSSFAASLPRRRESEIDRRLQLREAIMATSLNTRTVVIRRRRTDRGAGRRQLTAKGVDVLVLERGATTPTAPQAKSALASATSCAGTSRQPLGRTGRSRPTRFAIIGGETALPIRTLAGFPAGRGRGRCGQSLERPHLALGRVRSEAAHAAREPLWQEGHSRRHADPGLGRHLCRDGALSRPVREAVRHRRQGGQSARQGAGRRQSVRGAAAATNIRNSRCETTEAGVIFTEAAKKLGYKPFPMPAANSPAPTPIRTACGSARASTAATANASSAKRTPRRARRCCSTRCCGSARVSRCACDSHVLGIDYDARPSARPACATSTS